MEGKAKKWWAGREPLACEPLSLCCMGPEVPHLMPVRISLGEGHTPWREPWPELSWDTCIGSSSGNPERF